MAQDELQLRTGAFSFAFANVAALLAQLARLGAGVDVPPLPNATISLPPDGSAALRRDAAVDAALRLAGSLQLVEGGYGAAGLFVATDAQLTSLGVSLRARDVIRRPSSQLVGVYPDGSALASVLSETRRVLRAEVSHEEWRVIMESADPDWGGVHLEYLLLLADAVPAFVTVYLSQPDGWAQSLVLQPVDPDAAVASLRYVLTSTNYCHALAVAVLGAAGRLDPIQQYYRVLLEDGTPEFTAIAERHRGTSLERRCDASKGNHYVATEHIPAQAPLFVFGGELGDPDAFLAGHARWVKQLEYKRTYIDGYPYEADGTTLRLPSTHHGPLLNEPSDGRPTARFADVVPYAFKRGALAGLLPPVKLVLAGARGLEPGQEITVTYGAHAEARGVEHPHVGAMMLHASSCRGWRSAGVLGADVEVRASATGASTGLHALVGFRRGDFVTEYCGAALTSRAASSLGDKRYLMPVNAVAYIDGLREPVDGLGGGSFVVDPFAAGAASAAPSFGYNVRRCNGPGAQHHRVFYKATCNISPGDEIFADFSQSALSVGAARLSVDRSAPARDAGPSSSALVVPQSGDVSTAVSVFVASVASVPATRRRSAELVVAPVVPAGGGSAGTAPSFAGCLRSRSLHVMTAEGCTLACGSCFELVAALPDSSVSLVVIDPPSGAYTYHWEWDKPWSAGTWAALIPQLWRVLDPHGRLVIFTCGSVALSELTQRVVAASDVPSSRDPCVWVHHGKRGAQNPQAPYRAHEGFDVYRRRGAGVDRSRQSLGAARGSDVFVVPRTSTESSFKPVALMEQVICAFSRPASGVVLDVGMGKSGVTGVAAARVGRPFLGFELYDGRFEEAARSIATALGAPLVDASVPAEKGGGGDVEMRDGPQLSSDDEPDGADGTAAARTSREPAFAAALQVEPRRRGRSSGRLLGAPIIGEVGAALQWPDGSIQALQVHSTATGVSHALETVGFAVIDARSLAHCIMNEHGDTIRQLDLVDMLQAEEGATALFNGVKEGDASTVTYHPQGGEPRRLGSTKEINGVAPRWASQSASLVEQSLAYLGLHRTVDPVQKLLFRAPSQKEIDEQTPCCLEQPCHSDSVARDSLQGTGDALLEPLSLMLAVDAANRLGVFMPQSLVRATLTHSAGTALLLRADFGHCGWWSAVDSWRLFAKCRVPRRKRGSDNKIHLFEAEFRQASPSVADRSEARSLALQHGTIDAPLPQWMRDNLQAQERRVDPSRPLRSANRKRAADTQLDGLLTSDEPLRELAALLLDAQFEQHGVHGEWTSAVREHTSTLRCADLGTLDGRVLGLGVRTTTPLPAETPLLVLGGVLFATDVPPLDPLIRRVGGRYAVDSSKVASLPTVLRGALVHQPQHVASASSNLVIKQVVPFAALRKVLPNLQVFFTSRRVRPGEILWSDDAQLRHVAAEERVETAAIPHIEPAGTAPQSRTRLLRSSAVPAARDDILMPSATFLASRDLSSLQQSYGTIAASYQAARDGASQDGVSDTALDTLVNALLLAHDSHLRTASATPRQVVVSNLSLSPGGLVNLVRGLDTLSDHTYSSVLWGGCGTGFEVVALLLILGARGVDSSIVACDDSSSNIQASLLLLGRALVAAGVETPQSFASKAPTSPFRIGSASLRFKVIDLGEESLPQLRPSLVWTTVPGVEALRDLWAAAGGCGHVCAPGSVWALLPWRSPVVLSLSLSRERGQPKLHEVRDLRQFPMFSQVAAPGLDVAGAPDWRLQVVPPGWTRVDDSSSLDVQSLLRVGARVATYYEPDRVWCPGFVVPHVGPRGVRLALAYDDVRGTRVGDGEEPFTGVGDFEHHLLVQNGETTQAPESLQYCTEVEFRRLQRIFLGDDTAMILPTADALYSPSLQVHSSGQGLTLLEEPVKENGFAVLGIATGVRAKRLFAPTNSLCMTASDVLKGSLTDLWTLAARPSPSAVSSAAANSYFAPVEVSLQDTSTALESTFVLALLTTTATSGQELVLRRELQAPTSYSDWDLFVYLRSLGHYEMQTALQVLLSYGSRLEGAPVRHGRNTAPLRLANWGLSPGGFAFDSSRVTARAVLFQYCAGSAFPLVAVFVLQDGSVDFPMLKQRGLHQRAPPMKDFTCDGVALDPSLHGAAVRPRGLRAGTLRVVQLWKVPIRTLPPSTQPGSLEWMPLGAALLRLRPATDDHPQYHERLRQLLSHGFGDDGSGFRGDSSDDSDDDGDEAPGGGGEGPRRSTRLGVAGGSSGAAGASSSGDVVMTSAVTGRACCMLCHLDNPIYLLTINGDCYCNVMASNARTSCAILRLQRSADEMRTPSVVLPATARQDISLICCRTGSTDFASLGVMTTSADDTRLVTVSATVAQESLDDLGLDPSRWAPFVVDGAVASWLVPTAASDAVVRVPEVALTGRDTSHPLPAQYANARHYAHRLGAVLIANAQEEQQKMAPPIVHGIAVTWTDGLNGLPIGCLRSSSLQHHSLAVGQRLRVSSADSGEASCGVWEAAGEIIKLDGAECIVSVSRWSSAPPHGESSLYDVSKEWHSLPFDRQRLALSCFADGDAALAPELRDIVLGFPLGPLPRRRVRLPALLQLPGQPQLTPSQEQGIRHALTRPLTLIQGPPGTGKTTEIVSILVHWVQQKRGAALVCAPSNVAVNNLAERLAPALHPRGARVLRFESQARQHLQQGPHELTMEYHLNTLKDSEKVVAEYVGLCNLKAQSTELRKKHADRLSELRKIVVRRVIAEADVICCTCSAAGDGLLASSFFPFVVVDEAAQATEADTLVPLVLGSRQLVLVGDDQQLGPVVTSQAAQKAGLGTPLFTRMRLCGHVPVLLDTQYRMHPSIAAYPSSAFYGGQLVTGVSAADRTDPLSLPSPWDVEPRFFFCNYSTDDQGRAGSKYNAGEALVVVEMLRKLLLAGVPPCRVAIITPYVAQRTLLSSKVAAMLTEVAAPDAPPLDVEINSVDAFQGRETDFVIVSTVRSNLGGDVGFLESAQRLNVAITRSRFGLAVIGNPDTLRRTAVFAGLLQHYHGHSAVYGGDPSSPVRVTLSLPSTPPVPARDAFEAAVVLTVGRSSELVLTSGSSHAVSPETMPDPGEMAECLYDLVFAELHAQLPSQLHKTGKLVGMLLESPEHCADCFAPPGDDASCSPVAAAAGDALDVLHSESLLSPPAFDPGARVPCVQLGSPFLAPVLSNFKTLETRSWDLFGQFLGQRVGIYAAAKGWPTSATERARFLGRIHELVALKGSPPGTVLRSSCLPPHLQAGQVVGTVLVGHTQRLTLDCVQLMGGWWAVAMRACLPVDHLADAMRKGLYVTDLTDARWFDEGVPLTGRMQGGVGHFLFPDPGPFRLPWDYCAPTVDRGPSVPSAGSSVKERLQECTVASFAQPALTSPAPTQTSSGAPDPASLPFTAPEGLGGCFLYPAECELCASEDIVADCCGSCTAIPCLAVRCPSHGCGWSLACSCVASTGVTSAAETGDPPVPTCSLYSAWTRHPSVAPILDGILVAAQRRRKQQDGARSQRGSRPPITKQLLYGTARHILWWWRARYVGWMSSVDTLAYWRCANNRRLVPLAEIIRCCSYARGARPPPAFGSVSEATAVKLALASDGTILAPARSSVATSPRTGLLRLTPVLFCFRVVCRPKCGFGSVPLATPDDFAEARAEAQKSIEFLAPEVAFMRRCLPQAMVLCPFGTPGGHTLGARAAGMPAVLMDVNILQTSRRFFEHPDNASPLVSVFKGDALDPEAREAAIQSHPLQRDCVLNFDCPPCAPNATPVISGSRAGPDHRCIASSLSLQQQQVVTHDRVRLSESTLGSRPAMAALSDHFLLNEAAFGLPLNGVHVFAHDAQHPVVVPQRIRDIEERQRARICAGPRPIPQLHPSGVPLQTLTDSDGCRYACCRGNVVLGWGARARTQKESRRLARAAELPHSFPVSPQHVVDALPVPMSSFLVSAAIASANRLRFGKPLITEDDALHDDRLAGWRRALLSTMPEMLEKGQQVPFPVQRCILLVLPSAMPECVLVDSAGCLPSVDVPPYGPPLLASVAARAHATFDQLPELPRNYRFLCDALGLEKPAVVFRVWLLNDEHVGAISSWHAGAGAAEKEGGGDVELAHNEALYFLAIEAAASVLSDEDMACMAEAEQQGLVQLDYVPFGARASSSKLHVIPPLPPSEVAPIQLKVNVPRARVIRLNKRWLPPLDGKVLTEIPVVQQVDRHICFASLTDRREQYIRLCQALDKSLGTQEAELPAPGSTFKAVQSRLDSPKALNIEVHGLLLAVPPDAGAAVDELANDSDGGESRRFLFLGSGGTKLIPFLANTPVTLRNESRKGKGAGKGKSKGGGKGKGRVAATEASPAAVEVLHPDSTRLQRRMNVVLEAVFGGVETEAKLLQRCHAALKSVPTQQYEQMIHPYRPRDSQLTSMVGARKYIYQLSVVYLPCLLDPFPQYSRSASLLSSMDGMARLWTEVELYVPGTADALIALSADWTSTSISLPQVSSFQTGTSVGGLVSATLGEAAQNFGATGRRPLQPLGAPTNHINQAAAVEPVAAVVASAHGMSLRLSEPELVQVLQGELRSVAAQPSEAIQLKPGSWLKFAASATGPVCWAKVDAVELCLSASAACGHDGLHLDSEYSFYCRYGATARPRIAPRTWCDLTLASSQPTACRISFTTCFEEDPVTSPFPDQLSLEVAEHVDVEPREEPSIEEGSVAASQTEEEEVSLQCSEQWFSLAKRWATLGAVRALPKKELRIAGKWASLVLNASKRAVGNVRNLVVPGGVLGLATGAARADYILQFADCVSATGAPPDSIDGTSPYVLRKPGHYKRYAQTSACSVPGTLDILPAAGFDQVARAGVNCFTRWSCGPAAQKVKYGPSFRTDSKRVRAIWFEHCLQQLAKELEGSRPVTIIVPWGGGCDGDAEQWGVFQEHLRTFAETTPGILLTIVKPTSTFIQEQEALCRATDAVNPEQLADAHARSQEALLKIEDPVERVTCMALNNQFYHALLPSNDADKRREAAEMREALSSAELKPGYSPESARQRAAKVMHGNAARFRRSGDTQSTPDSAELRTDTLKEFYKAALQNFAISNAPPNFDSGDSTAVERAANCVGVPAVEGVQINQLECLDYAAAPVHRSQRLYSAPPPELRQALADSGVEWHAAAPACADSRWTAEARRAPSSRPREEPFTGTIDCNAGVGDDQGTSGDWEWFEEWEALPSGGFNKVSSAAAPSRADAAIAAVDAYAAGCAFAVELAEQAWNRMLARSLLEREAETARFRAYLREQHKAGAFTASQLLQSLHEVHEGAESQQVLETQLPTQTRKQRKKVFREPPPLTPFSPSISITSADGAFTPCFLQGVSVMSDSGATGIPLEHLEVKSMGDTGSSTVLFGVRDVERINRLAPGALQVIDKPLPTSVRSIKGVGPNAHNLVLYHVRCTLNMGGFKITFDDAPVINGFSSLLMGNDFNDKVCANYDYTEGRTEEGHHYDGVLTLRDRVSSQSSSPIPFATRHATPATSFAAEVNLADDESARPVVDEPSIEDVLKGATPVAYAPQHIEVAGWHEQFIELRVPTAACASKTIGVAPLEDSRSKDLGVLVTPGIYTVSETGHVRVSVINLNRRAVRIPLLTPIARYVVDPTVWNTDLKHSTEEIMQQVHFNSELTEMELAEVREMIESRRRLFNDLGWAQGYKQVINTPGIPDKYPPPALPNRRRSAEEEETLRKYIDKLLSERLIEPTRSPYNAMPMLVRKATGGYRVVIDFRLLNQRVEKDRYPLPNIDSHLSALGDSCWFTTLDLLQGFHQVELEEESKAKTAFGTPWGQYAYTRMPMGLTSSPGAFMRLVDSALRGLPFGYAFAFVDDVLIPSSGTFAQHLEQVGKVFDRLVEAGLTVRPDKVWLAMREVKYLGFLVGQYGTRPDPAKTAALLAITAESFGTDVAAASRFAGMVGFYHKFIPQLHTLLQPFHDLKTKKAGPVTEQIMTSLRFKAATAEIVRRVAGMTALARPDYSKPFYIHVDTATSNGTGAVLSQRRDEDDPESHVPLAFRSRRITHTEQRYPVRDQEAMGLVEALQDWHTMLGGQSSVKIIVCTDHRSLRWLLTTRHSDGSRISGYSLKIQEYDVELRWLPGSDPSMIPPDTLSREPFGNGSTSGPSLSKQEEFSDQVLESNTLQRPAAGAVLQLTWNGLRCDTAESTAISAHPSAIQSADRIAAVFVFRTLDGWDFLLEQREGALVLPSVATDPSLGSQTYRTQLKQYLERSYDTATSRVLAYSLSSKKASKHKVSPRPLQKTAPQQEQADVDRRGSACIFLAQVSDSTLQLVPLEKQCCCRVPLTPQSAATLTEDSDFTMVLAVHDSLYKERNSHFAIKPLPLLAEENTSSVVSASDADLSPPRLSAENPFGPALVDRSCTLGLAMTAIERVAERLRRNPGMPIGLDLEGELGGPRPRIALLQLGVPEDLATGEPVVEYVIDICQLDGLLWAKGPSTLRDILEDPDIPISMHCCRTDTSALYFQFGIVCTHIFDTGVADGLVHYRPANKPRGLGKCLVDWLGEDQVHLTHKGQMTFVPFMFEKRPLTYMLWLYSLEDIRYSCALYVKLKAALVEAKLLDVAHSLFQLREPPAYLPPTHPLHSPCTSALLVLADADRMVLAAPLDEEQFATLPSAAVSPQESSGAQNWLRACAQRGWTRHFGEPPVGVKGKLFNESKRLTRLGSLTLYAAIVKDVDEYLPRLQLAFMLGPLGQTHTLRSVSRLSPLDECGVNIPTEFLAAVQYLRVDALRRRPQLDAIPIVSVALGPQFTPGRAAIVVRDGTYLYVSMGKARTDPFRFPYSALEVHGTAADAAIRAFDQFSGSVLRKRQQEQPSSLRPALPPMAPEFSAALNEALDNLAYLGEFSDPALTKAQLANNGPTHFFLCDVPFSFREYASLFVAARSSTNGFNPNPSAPSSKQKSAGTCFRTLDELEGRLLAADALALAAVATRQHSPSRPPFLSIPPSVPLTFAHPVSTDESRPSQHSDVNANVAHQPPLASDSDDPEVHLTALVTSLSLIRLSNILRHLDDEGSPLVLCGETLSCDSQVDERNDQGPTTGFRSVTVCPVEELKASTDRSSGIALPLNNDLQLDLPTVREVQMEHPATRQFIDYITSGEGLPPHPEAQQELAFLFLRDGVLLRRIPGVSDGVVIAPPRLWRRICYAHHDRNGHFGVQKTRDAIKARYYWAGMDQYIVEYVNGCQLCPFVKVPRHLAGQSHIPPIGEHPFDVTSGDVFDTGVKREDGSKIEVASFGCTMTKAVFSDVPAQPPTSEYICQTLITLIVRYFGVPRIFFSDHGSIYASKVTKLLFKLYGIKVRASASYHHRTLGHIERWHGTLRTLLLALRKARPNCDLTVYIGWLNLAFNSAVNSLTKYSPSFLMTLRNVRLPHDLIFDPPAASTPLPDWVREQLKVLGASYDAVSQTLNLNTLSNLKKCDLKRDPLLQYSPGDQVVLVKGSVVDKNHPKAVFPSKGPYVITKVLPNDNYLLQGGDSGRLRAPIHVDRLLPYPPARPPDIANSPVQRIVGHRWTDNVDRDLGGKQHQHRRLEYRIRWLGFKAGADSYRSLPYLVDIPHIVEAYNRSHAKEIPPEYRVLDGEGESLDPVRPPLSDAAVHRRHYRRRPRQQEQPSAPAPPSESPPASSDPVPVPDAALDEDAPSPPPAPQPTSDLLPTEAKQDSKGTWLYLRKTAGRHGPILRWINASQFSATDLESLHFTQLRDAFIGQQ